MIHKKLTLSLIPRSFAVCRLSPDSEIPQWAIRSAFYSVMKTPEELTVVCVEGNVPEGVKSEREWKVLQIEGSFDFSLTGIISSLAYPLAKADISIFVLSTYDTDCIMVKQNSLKKAISVLTAAGHRVNDS